MPTNTPNLTASELRQREKPNGINSVEINGNRVNLDGLSQADAQLASQFGYKPVFRREFGYLSTFSFAVSISGLFSTVMTTFSFPLAAGGSASAVWCWLISGAGCMCLACSVAELVSAYPTSGGLYYTISRLAPREWVPSLSWITGWINLLGQVAGVASCEYGAAQMLLAAVAMNSGTTTRLVKGVSTTAFNYVISTKHTVGVMTALTVVTGLVNSLSTRWMEKMTKTYVIFHACILVSCCVALLVATPQEYRHDARYVFTNVESESGWRPVGFSFLFGFLSVSWTMTDYDATAHIAEEISEPEVKAPWAISMAMLFTYVAGFLFNIVLCFCMGDPATILASGIDQPVAQIYYNALGRGGGVFFTVCGFIIIKFVCFTAMQSLARTVFAFSRDKLLPFSPIWTRVSPLTNTPLHAAWLSTALCILINLIALGSYAAVSGVFDVCAIALDWSYCIPIACKLLARRRFERGPWHLGAWSAAVNVWACLWTLFVSVIFLLPTARPVRAAEMNYASAFLALIGLFAAGFWWLWGRTRYVGPVAEAARRGADDADSAATGSEAEGAREGEGAEKGGARAVADTAVADRAVAR